MVTVTHMRNLMNEVKIRRGVRILDLPCDGPLSASDINVELGREFNAKFIIGGNAERALAGVVSGEIKFSDFYCKSNDPVNKIHDVRAYYESDAYDRATAQAQGWIFLNTPTELRHMTAIYQGESNAAVPPALPAQSSTSIIVADVPDWTLYEYQVIIPTLDVYQDEGNAAQNPINELTSGTWYPMPTAAGARVGIHVTVNADVFTTDRSAARYVNMVWNIRLIGAGTNAFTITSRMDAEAYSES